MTDTRPLVLAGKGGVYIPDALNLSPFGPHDSNERQTRLFSLETLPERDIPLAAFKESGHTRQKSFILATEPVIS